MVCKKGFEVQLCQSSAGYYLGTKDDTGAPNCRLTGYAKTAEAAQSLKLDRQFYCIENEFCNGKTGCFEDGDKNAV